MNLADLFTRNLSPRQKQYEAVRAVAFSEGTLAEIAARFGYTPSSLRVLVHRVASGKQALFPDVKRGPQKPQTSPDAAGLAIRLRRRKRWNSQEIAEELGRSGFSISARTVERILAEAGFPKLRRRTDRERGISKKGVLIAPRSGPLDFATLQPFHAECQVAGVFFFLPYILESGILDIVKQCSLPHSSDIGSQQAALSMLLLKLIGNERLSHIQPYDADRGFGVFAGLNALPKPAYMGSYSCRTDAATLLQFQREIIARFRDRYPALYPGQTINLDFHSIPHFGEESEMEPVWCGSRGKAMKGAHTFFAQDGISDSLLYTRADIQRREACEEIKSFVDYWLQVKGIVDETLVFDSKLTRYEILHELDKDNIKFITLRIRSQKLIEEALRLPEAEWEKVYLPIPKRKYKHVKAHQSQVALLPGEKPFRQIIVKDHGRSEPTFILTNRDQMKLVDILTIYAKRWHIENKLAELVDFFSLNRLSSPILIRIHFDVLWTMIADTLYHIFAQELRRFDKCRSRKIFRHFIDMPGQVVFDGKSFIVKIRKHAATPILMGIEKLKSDIAVPWLDNKPLRIVWTP
ncbi:MAG: transposase [Candidatus Omnitrophota bacterium]